MQKEKRRKEAPQTKQKSCMAYDTCVWGKLCGFIYYNCTIICAVDFGSITLKWHFNVTYATMNTNVFVQCAMDEITKFISSITMYNMWFLLWHILH
jgi:hypothetical protein